MKTRKTLLTAVIAAAIGTFTCFTYAEDKEGELKGKPEERGERGERGEGDRGKGRPGGDMALEIFKRVDANGDGKVGPKELADSRMFEDADRKEVAEAFGRWDKDGDGSIGPREFKEGMERRRDFMKGKGKGKGGKGGPKGKGGPGGDRDGDKGEGKDKGKGGPKGKGGKGDKA